MCIRDRPSTHLLRARLQRARRGQGSTGAIPKRRRNATRSRIPTRQQRPQSSRLWLLGWVCRQRARPGFLGTPEPGPYTGCDSGLQGSPCPRSIRRPTTWHQRNASPLYHYRSKRTKWPRWGSVPGKPRRQSNPMGHRRNLTRRSLQGDLRTRHPHQLRPSLGTDSPFRYHH